MVQHRGNTPSRPLLARMANALVHRGPATQLVLDGPAGLGWSGPRVDGEAPAQPHVTADVVVMIDGWIVVEDQQDPGATPPRSQDPAALLGAWTRWGLDLVEHVDGDFAGVILERKSGIVHLFRDRQGLRNLYWARQHGCIAFATDLEPLLSVPWVSREVNRDHIAEYMSFRVVHEPRTLLRDVSQLEPGQRLRFSPEAVRLHTYFRPRYAAPDTPVPREADVVGELQSVVERAVHRRLSSRERAGVYLSGGIGSAAVVATARTLSRTVKTFTVAFDDEDHPESPFAGRVARLLGMEHRTVLATSKNIAAGFDKTVAAMGHPIGNPTAVLQLLLADAARSEVDVVLTGDGADEVFGGRMLAHPVEELRRAQRFARMPYPLRKSIGRLLRRSERLRGATTPPEVFGLVHGIGGAHLFTERERRMLLLDDQLVRPEVRVEVLEPFYAAVDTDPVNSMLHAFQRSSLIAENLPKLDRTAAAVGLEVRLPFLDRELLRFARLLPGGYKARRPGGGLPSRWLLRAMLHGALPAALINRPDRSMTSPLGDWLAGPGRLFMEDRYTRLRRDPLELWHTTGLEALRRGIGRRPGAAGQLWALFILDAWLARIGAT